MIDQDKIREVLKQSGIEIELTAADFDMPFKDIGIDSLDVFNFFSEVELTLGKSIEDSDFDKINTLNDVIRFLNG